MARRERRRPPWSWQGFVAAIIATALGVGFAVAMVGATLQNQQISPGGAALLNTLGGGLVAALSLWIGSQVEGAAQERERNHAAPQASDVQERPQHPGDSDEDHRVIIEP